MVKQIEELGIGVRRGIVSTIEQEVKQAETLEKQVDKEYYPEKLSDKGTDADELTPQLEENLIQLEKAQEEERQKSLKRSLNNL